MVRCPGCDAVNPLDAAACQHCGTEISLHCGRCQAGNPPTGLKRMPKDELNPDVSGPALPAADVDLIRQWILDGAPNN